MKKKLSLMEYIEVHEARILTESQSAKNSLKVTELEGIIKKYKAQLADASDEAAEDIFDEAADKLVAMLRRIIKSAVYDNLYLDEKYIKACKFFFSKADKKGEDKKEFDEIVSEINDYFKACLGDRDAREAWETKKQQEASEKTTVGKSEKAEKEEEEKEVAPSDDEIKKTDTDSLEKDVQKEVEKDKKGNVKKVYKIVVIANKVTNESEIDSGKMFLTKATEPQIFAAEYKDDVEALKDADEKFEADIGGRNTFDKVLTKLRKSTLFLMVDDKKIYIYDSKAKETDNDPWFTTK